MHPILCFQCSKVDLRRSLFKIVFDLDIYDCVLATFTKVLFICVKPRLDVRVISDEILLRKVNLEVLDVNAANHDQSNEQEECYHPASIRKYDWGTIQSTILLE